MFNCTLVCHDVSVTPNPMSLWLDEGVACALLIEGFTFSPTKSHFHPRKQPQKYVVSKYLLKLMPPTHKFIYSKFQVLCQLKTQFFFQVETSSFPTKWKPQVSLRSGNLKIPQLMQSSTTLCNHPRYSLPKFVCDQSIRYHGRTYPPQLFSQFPSSHCLVAMITLCSVSSVTVTNSIITKKMSKCWTFLNYYCTHTSTIYSMSPHTKFPHAMDWLGI